MTGEATNEIYIFFFQFMSEIKGIFNKTLEFSFYYIQPL